MGILEGEMLVKSKVLAGLVGFWKVLVSLYKGAHENNRRRNVTIKYTRIGLIK